MGFNTCVMEIKVNTPSNRTILFSGDFGKLFTKLMIFTKHSSSIILYYQYM